MTARRGVLLAFAPGVVVAVLAGCAQSHAPAAPGPSPKPTIVGRPFVESGSMTIATADPESIRDAVALRSAARLPPDAVVLAAPPAGAPTGPAVVPACYPIVQATEFFRTGRSETAPGWLEAHPGAGLTTDGHGAGSTMPFVTQVPAAPDPLEGQEHLVFTIAGGIVRVDADVVPVDAECASTGLVPPRPIPTETQTPLGR